MLCAGKLRLGLERAVERLDDAFDVEESTLGDPGDGRPLLGQVRSLEVGSRDLEQRDPSRSGIEIAACSLHQAREQPGSERGQLDRDRLGQLPGGVVVGPGTGTGVTNVPPAFLLSSTTFSSSAMRRSTTSRLGALGDRCRYRR